MKYEPAIELQKLRREQGFIHRLVQNLDQRLDRLSECIAVPEPVTGKANTPAASVPTQSDAIFQNSVPPAKTFTTSPAIEPPSQPHSSEKPTRKEAPAPTETPEPQTHAKHEPLRESSPADSTPLEFELGRVWLVRIGIVVLLTGLVFLGNLAYQHIVPRLGPGMKLGLIVAAGGALAGTGAWLENRRESLRNYARVLIAGGFAAMYYACYAAHFVAVLRVIENAVLGGALLLAFAGGIAWFAHRRRSETLASLAILLSYYTSCINPVGGFTLFSNVLLTASAVFFLVKNRWTRVTYLSVAATYASYAYWRFYVGGGSAPMLGVWAQTAFLACYWLLFTAAAFLTDRRAMNAAARTAFVAANNGAFFALAAHAISAGGGEIFWVFSLVYGLVLLALSRLAAWRDPEDRMLDGAYLAQGLALTTTGLASHLTGQQLAITFAAQGTVLLSCGRARQGRLLEIGGLLSLAASFALALSGLTFPTLHAIPTAGVVALALLFNAWWFKRQRDIGAERLHAVASSLAVAAFVLGFAWLEKVAGIHTASWCAVAALGFAFLPFAELAIFSQALLPVAVARWSLDLLLVRPLLPLDSTVILACGMSLAHWWPRNLKTRLDPMLRKIAEGVAAFSSVALAMIWLRREFSGADAMIASTLAGLAWIGASRLTRAGLLGISGLAFSVVTTADFFALQSTAHWAIALLPIAHVAIVGRLFRQHEASRACAPLAAFMLLLWSWEHIAVEWRALFYAAAGAGLAIIGALRRNVVASWITLVLGAFATGIFWAQLDDPNGPRNVAALLLFAAACRISRRLWPAEPMLGFASGIAWSTVVALTAWVTRHNALPSLTIAWSLLALAFFGAGLALRDRQYRLGGLALLGLSVGRVFFVEVWAFEPVFRIISFIVLGLVLLVIGYAYNRFEEKLRLWF